MSVRVTLNPVRHMISSTALRDAGKKCWSTSVCHDDLAEIARTLAPMIDSDTPEDVTVDAASLSLLVNFMARDLRGVPRVSRVSPDSRWYNVDGELVSNEARDMRAGAGGK